MTASPTTLRDTIEAAWSLTGELSKTGTGTMKEVVQFYDREEVIGNEVTKSVSVQKINALGNEGVVVHPNFNEIYDIFEILLSYKVTDVEQTTFSTFLDNIEQMGDEVVRILKTVFDPSTGLGIYFRTSNVWTKEDIYSGNQPQLRRRLRFTLITVTSNDPEVFGDFDGILVFDTSATTAENKPASDYSFTAVKEVNLGEGYEQIPRLTSDKVNGVGIPHLVRGMFRGTFYAKMYGKKSDIDGATIEKLENIYLPETGTTASSKLFSQQARIVFQHANQNTETTPQKITRTSHVIVTEIGDKTVNEDLLTMEIRGVLFKPTIRTVTAV